MSIVRDNLPRLSSNSYLVRPPTTNPDQPHQIMKSPFLKLYPVAALIMPLGTSLLSADEAVPIHQDSFDTAEAFSNWFPTQPDRWKITDTTTDQGHTLHLLGPSKKYNPPFRSPHSIILLKDHVVGDFVLTAKVKTLQTSRGHRDMCIFWGWQDPSNFYYVHLGEKPDPNSSQIFIVNESPRTPITKTNAGGIPWEDDTWHEVKLVRKIDEGTIEVYFDDMITPVKTAQDTTYQWGMIGLGSFDDLGMWDDIKIDGVPIEGESPVLPTQNRSGATVQKKTK